MPQFSGTTDKCNVCDKTVYVAEKIVVEDKEERKTFHKTCLKCTHCKATLSLGNYASMNGVMYCKPHFKQLFATKGNYDEGFGKEKLTSKWTANPNSPSQSGGSFVPVDKEETKSAEKKETPSAISSKFSKSTEKCDKCDKPVYATEKIVIEEKEIKKVYHKPCLRCTHCQVILTLGSYAAMNGVTYCKPHLKQLFATKGNYDEGFGGEKHTSKWTPQAASSPNSFVPVEKSDISKDNKVSSPASEVANKFKSMSASDKCSVCGKTVYLTEKVVVEDKEDKKIFHKACLRCSHCQVVLSLGSYASMNGVMYCKPHFKQLFATKGNYDEGFGKQKHSAKWIEGDEEKGENKSDGSKSPERSDSRAEEHSHSHDDEHTHTESHSHEEHKHDEHEHSHEGHEHHEHEHGEHKHDDHEHKHDDHEHKHDDHEHKHDGHEHKHDEHEHSHQEHEHHDEPEHHDE